MLTFAKSEMQFNGVTWEPKRRGGDPDWQPEWHIDEDGKCLVVNQDMWEGWSVYFANNAGEWMRVNSLLSEDEAHKLAQRISEWTRLPVNTRTLFR